MEGQVELRGILKETLEEKAQREERELQESFRIQREELAAELKKSQEERPKALKRTQFLYDLVPYIPFFFNPANGILVAALAFSIATILAAVAPQLLPAAAPALLCIAAGGLIFSAVTIIPFTIWEAIKHYHEWRLKQSFTTTSEYDADLGEEVIKSDPYIGTFDHYQSTLLFVKPVKPPIGLTQLDEFKDKPVSKKASYATLTGFADSQLGQWAKAHYWQATIVGLGILFCALAIGACVGFFLGNPICFDLLHPVFTLFQSVFAAGINGLHLPFLAIFADPFVIEVITAVFITAVPLIIADNLRRMMDAVEFYSPPPPPADTSDSGFEIVGNAAKFRADEESSTLNELTENADTRTWNYLTRVFNKSAHTKELANQDFTGLDDSYDDLDSIEEEKPNKQLSN